VHVAPAGSDVAVAQVLPEQVGVPRHVQRRVGAPRTRGPFGIGRPAVSSAPIRDRRSRKAHRPGDVRGGPAHGVEAAGFVDQSSRVHGGMVVVATDNNERKVPPVGFEPTLYGF
jgi:hypothetical protein